ncbi:MAG TPA: diguanylate cyclase [Eubacteriales bacterium]|nr:diguanylate cyclase [Eubacteriales bacterium]
MKYRLFELHQPDGSEAKRNPVLLFHIVSLYLISIAVVVTFWAAYVKVLNGSSFTNTSLLLCIAICFYILGYALEINSSNETQILFWNHVEYIGIPFVSAFWLTTALLYTGHFSKHRTVLLAAIYIIPILSLVLRYTNNFHHLYFQSVSFTEEFGRLILVKKSGVWMYVQAVHSMLMIIISMTLFIRDAVKSREKQKGKILLTALASAVAVTGLVLSQIKSFRFTIDYMALCLPCTALLIIIAIAKYDLLETKSVARSRAFEFGGDATLLVNNHNRVIDFNAGAKHLFEQLGIRLYNGTLVSLLHEMPGFLSGLLSTQKNIVTLRLNGEERYFEISTRCIDERRATRGWIKTIRDISEVYRLNAELRRQAITDELSMLNNRRAFIQIGRELTEAAERDGTPLYLAMFDIDFFKNVNDRFGHPAGDFVIHTFGRLLKDHFGKNSLVARLGGEEFAVMLSGVGKKAALQSFNTFLKTIRQYRFVCREDQIQITVSIGVTVKSPGQKLESLMRNADKALYRSKDHGRDRITVI